MSVPRMKIVKQIRRTKFSIVRYCFTLSAFRLAALAEADPAVPGAAPERRLVGLHAAGPRAPRDAVLPPVCVPAAQGSAKQPHHNQPSHHHLNPHTNCDTIINNMSTLNYPYR